MPIKNSLKIFASKIQMLWTILLYYVIAGVIVFCLSLFEMVPVYDFFYDNGFIDHGSELIMSFVINGYSKSLLDESITFINNFVTVLLQNTNIFTIIVLYVVLVLGVLVRFLVGMLELPILKKFQGAMSDNGNYSFGGLFISVFGKSVLFSLAKILIKFAADCLLCVLLYFIAVGMIAANMDLFIPFVLVIVIVTYLAFKYGISAGWGVAIAIDGEGVFSAFIASAKGFFANFSKLFALYVIVWVLLFVANYIVLRYTFGAGLIITLPISLLIINAINATYYYDLKKYRYYVSGEVVEPVDRM